MVVSEPMAHATDSGIRYQPVAQLAQADRNGLTRASLSVLLRLSGWPFLSLAALFYPETIYSLIYTS